MKKCNDIRTEMKIGLLSIALFGVCNAVVHALLLMRTILLKTSPNVLFLWMREKL